VNVNAFPGDQHHLVDECDIMARFAHSPSDEIF
jgi:hypothetical protein